jgi:hypothetical protein
LVVPRSIPTMSSFIEDSGQAERSPYNKKSVRLKIGSDARNRPRFLPGIK